MHVFRSLQTRNSQPTPCLYITSRRVLVLAGPNLASTPSVSLWSRSLTQRVVSNALSPIPTSTITPDSFELLEYMRVFRTRCLENSKDSFGGNYGGNGHSTSETFCDRLNVGNDAILHAGKFPSV
jgi:hypothetical protein